MEQKRFKTLLWIILLVLSPSVQADDLSVLIARLKTLSGTIPLQAMVTVDKEYRGQDNKTQQDWAEFEIVVDANGVALRLSRDAVHASAIQSLSLNRINDITNYASTLAGELKDLKLVKRIPDTYGDIACQRWQFEYVKKESKFGAQGMVRRNVYLWVDRDGYPIAALFKDITDINMFFWKQHNESMRPQRYQRYGDRLVLIEDKQTTSIQHDKDTSNETVTTRVNIKER